jgi:nucleotide-binding universal stress UspA family protein
MYKRILVPLDGSDLSEEALPLARMLAEMNKAEIVLLRVVEYPSTLYSTSDEYPPSDPNLAKTILSKKRSISREVKSYLERIASTIRAAGVKVTSEICESPVVEAITAATDRLHVDLIVLSTCGQSGCTQCMMGAIADRVLREAQVPVIMIRPAPHSITFSLEGGHGVALSA